MRFPETIRRFLDEHHAGGVSEEDCRACSSPCCSFGGFAILENVIAIHQRYARGALKRSDYAYAPDLNFGDFVFRYFDVFKKTVAVNGAEQILMLFHMKSLSAGGELISIQTPARVVAGNDWAHTRSAAFAITELMPNATLWDCPAQAQTAPALLAEILAFTGLHTQRLEH